MKKKTIKGKELILQKLIFMVVAILIPLKNTQFDAVYISSKKKKLSLYLTQIATV